MGSEMCIRDRVCGDWTREDLQQQLAEKNEPQEVINCLLQMAERIETGPYVQDIFIQLTGKRAIPEKEEFTVIFFVRNALQSALILTASQYVDDHCVREVAKTFTSSQGILRTLEDGMERGLYSEEVYEQWKTTLCD